MKKLGMEETWITEYTGRWGEWRKRCAEKIAQNEKTEWRKDVERKSRLSTYAKVKRELKREKYLDFLRGEEMRAVLDLRGGANDLEIDRGRQEKKPRAERICKVCKAGVEDEVHVLTKCAAYHEQRRAFQEKLKLSELLEMEHFVELIGSSEKNKKQWKSIGRFAAAIFKRRKERLTQL